MKGKTVGKGSLAFYLGILLTSLAFIPQVQAQGGTVVLNPTDDAYIYGNLPARALGGG